MGHVESVPDWAAIGKSDLRPDGMRALCSGFVCHTAKIDLIGSYARVTICFELNGVALET